jgi:hypothetical protein
VLDSPISAQVGVVKISSQGNSHDKIAFSGQVRSELSLSMLGMETSWGIFEVLSIELSSLVRNHLPNSMDATATTTYIDQTSDKARPNAHYLRPCAQLRNSIPS